MTTKFLTIDQVIEIHDTFLQVYVALAGIRDHGLLASAVEMPRVTMFGEDVHPTLYDKAAAYLYHTREKHPFNDGNKRRGGQVHLLCSFGLMELIQNMITILMFNLSSTSPREKPTSQRLASISKNYK